MKIFLLLSLFFIQSFALDLVSNKTAVYKQIDIAYNIKDINQAIEYKDSFKNIKHYVRLFRNKSNKELWLKIPLENTGNKTIERSFVSRWDRVDFEFYVVKNDKLIFSESLSTKSYLKESSSIKLKAKEKIDFYVHVKTNRSVDQFYYIYFINKSSVSEFIKNTEKLFHQGLFFGILMTMAMYSFFMFFSIRDKGYLFLGFYQIIVLVDTSDLKSYFFILFENVPVLSEFLLRSLFSYLMMLFTILFTKEFLNTKEEMPIFNMFLNTLIIFLLPLNFIESNIDYASFLFIVFVFMGLYVFFNKKSLLVFFYILGFLGFPVYFILLNLGIMFDWNFYFEFHYTKQIFTCVESFALTMALYLKIRAIVNEKEKAKEEALKNEKILLEQSRFASMGEMLASIAHQWRQPLNHINVIMANLQLAFDNNKLDKTYLEKKSNEADKQLKYMSSTLESFSTFFAQKDKEEQFILEDICIYTLSLVESRIKKNQIEVNIDSTDKQVYLNYKNEIIQVLSIVLNNAIDALILNKIENKKINIQVNKKEIIIEDNAKGIKENIINKIFDPYFTTKDKKFGVGLGLYTSKIIMENIVKGKIEVENSNLGARFTIVIP